MLKNLVFLFRGFERPEEVVPLPSPSGGLSARKTVRWTVFSEDGPAGPRTVAAGRKRSFPCSLFPVPCSLFPPGHSYGPKTIPTPYSLLPTPSSPLFPVPCSLFPRSPNNSKDGQAMRLSVFLSGTKEISSRRPCRPCRSCRFRRASPSGFPPVQ